MSHGDPQLVEVYRAANLLKAHAIRLALESAGVTARIDGELLQGALGEVPLGWQTVPRILVAREQIEEAREIIARNDIAPDVNPFVDAQSDLTRCLACGHEMSESEDVCAACGWTFADDEELTSDESDEADDESDD